VIGLKNMQKRHRMASILLAMVITVSLPQSAFGSIIDIAGHWAAPVIGLLEARGIVAGDVDGRFSPEASLTRAQMAKIIVLGLGRESDAKLLATLDSPFPDIARGHWATGYIASLAEQAVTLGYPDGTFGPTDVVTRAQMALFLVRAAGLSGQARLQSFEVTTYVDDQAIPDWARGAVQVALANGLMAGFEDHTFRPLQPITKAEGSIALFRLMGFKGLAFNLTGTLVRYDTNTLTGVVRDELGQERSFTMQSSARFFRGGALVSAQQIRPLDQVWIVLDNDGLGRFMDARFSDLLASRAHVQGQSLTATVDGKSRTLVVQQGAVILLNGHQASLAEIEGAEQVYVVLDRQSGEVRVLDAVNTPIHGEFVLYDTTRQTITVAADAVWQTYPLAPDIILLRSGVRIGPTDLVIGEQLRIALNPTNQINYVQVER
jgi:hypothetical protein